MKRGVLLLPSLHTKLRIIREPGAQACTAAAARFRSIAVVAREAIEREPEHDLAGARRPRAIALNVGEALEKAADIDQQPAEFRTYGIKRMGLLWPWSIVAPLNPLRAAEYFDTFFEKPWRELYAGKLYAVTEMPVGYLPRLFALKLPEIMIGTFPSRQSPS